MDYVEVFWTFLWNLVKIFKKLLEKLQSKCRINFGKIIGKHRSNCVLDTDFVKIIKKYWKYRCTSIRIDILVENIDTYWYWKFFDIDTTKSYWKLATAVRCCWLETYRKLQLKILSEWSKIENTVLKTFLMWPLRKCIINLWTLETTHLEG